MFITKKKHNKIVSEILANVMSLSDDTDERNYFYEKGVQAAKNCLNGYVMVDASLLPNGKNCALFIGHGVQKAADMLKISNKKWGRLYSDEQRKLISKLRKLLRG